MQVTRISELENPTGKFISQIVLQSYERRTDSQIEEMSQLAADAFENSGSNLRCFSAYTLTRELIAIMNRSMTAGISSLRKDLFRLIFRTTSLEGRIYICQAISSGKILSIAAGFGPGNKFLGR